MNKAERKEFWRKVEKVFYEKFLVWFIFFDFGMILIIAGLCGSKTFSTIAIPIGVVLIVIVLLVIFFANRKRNKTKK